MIPWIDVGEVHIGGKFILTPFAKI